MNTAKHYIHKKGFYIREIINVDIIGPKESMGGAPMYIL